MSAYGHGRHEHGQNFLTNHKIINSIIVIINSCHTKTIFFIFIDNTIF